MKIDNDILCDSITLMEGSKGIFVSMPSYKNKQGEYKNYCNPITKEYKESLDADIMEMYNGYVKIHESIEERHAKENQVSYSVNESVLRKEAEQEKDEDVPIEPKKKRK